MKETILIYEYQVKLINQKALMVWKPFKSFSAGFSPFRNTT